MTVAGRYRAPDPLTPTGAAKTAPHAIARRWAALDTEIRTLDRDITTILDTSAAPLLAHHGLGYQTTGSLLCAAGHNPDRLATQASFTALCDTSPVPESSRRAHQHRHNHAADRQANAAPWRIVVVRPPSRHAATIGYLQRRVSAENSKRDPIRCPKHYPAHEPYNDTQAIITTTQPRTEIAA